MVLHAACFVELSILQTVLETAWRDLYFIGELELDLCRKTAFRV